jgi:hypothetical protein
MGAAGLLRIDLEQVPSGRGTIDAPEQSVFYFYKLIYLGESSNKEILACAGRTSGLMRIGSGEDDPLDLVGLVSQNIDLIDVCSIPSSEWPFAVVGLSYDRSLIFVRDLLANEAPQTLRLGEMRGTPYSILSNEGHLFVLTSEEMMAFPNLLSDYLQGDSLDRPFRYRYTPIQAVDAYIALGEHLIIILDDEVRLYEIPRLVRPPIELVEVQDWSEEEQVPTLVQASWESLVT